MSSRGVLVSKDSVESFTDFPIEASSSPPPRTPRSPHSLHVRVDYFDRSHHRGNNTIKLFLAEFYQQNFIKNPTQYIFFLAITEYVYHTSDVLIIINIFVFA